MLLYSPKLLLLALLAAGVESARALTPRPSPNAASLSNTLCTHQRHTPRTTMQLGNFFNNKQDSNSKKDTRTKNKSKTRTGAGFYDDEIDTVSRQPWTPEFVENGQVDLANVGGVYYLAFIPFLLFVAAFSTGGFSFGYQNGNF